MKFDIKKRLPREEYKKYFVICDCGYWNNKVYIDRSGKCKCCNKKHTTRNNFRHNLLMEMRK